MKLLKLRKYKNNGSFVTSEIESKPESAGLTYFSPVFHSCNP